ncbi:carbohydrate ABC transporter permease [Neorhizobium alkalisoli]|uniref:Carbohydrate ABC transporter membrane protein 1 (CUT1 family) n=1 Tax=Neorhizobium alkalisoli TaxID=528178 RepID=A0A561Q0V9_9HYPH|nr:sugar ABC transporter permease [Neorhizobium alkalisoli]TWF44008.1 carbohydrate ABC transporter membrane protein 1 (CUT1 family) [Neorhizobium alkalisoli]
MPHPTAASGRDISRRNRSAAFLEGWGPALVFLCPALVMLCLFKLWPIAEAIHTSTGTFDPGGQRIDTAGFDNFGFALSDSRFQWGLWLSLAAAIVKVPVQLALGLAAALMLRANTGGNALVRAMVISPMFFGLPVTTFVFAYLFDANVGAINAILSGIGLPRVAWLSTEAPAQLLVLGLSVWRDVGVTMLVFLAGLSAIPPQIAAAARLDGAGPLALFFTITLPLLARSFQFAVVLATLASFQILVPVLMLTKGGPTGATDLASFQIYETAFSYFDLGTASSMSLLLLVGLIVVIALELRWLAVKWTYE